MIIISLLGLVHNEWKAYNSARLYRAMFEVLKRMLLESLSLKFTQPRTTSYKIIQEEIASSIGAGAINKRFYSF